MLKTKQSDVTLQRIQKKHLPLVMGWRNSDHVRRWSGQEGLISEAQQLAWFERQDDNTNDRYFSICDRSNWPIGVCGLSNVDMVARRAEFSVYIGKESVGKGHSIAALSSLFNYGFMYIGLNMIYGFTFMDNEAAQKLFERVGMKQSGCIRDYYFKRGRFIDAYVYDTTRDDFEKDNPDL